MSIETQPEEARLSARRLWINLAIWGAILGVLAVVLGPLLRPLASEIAAGRIQGHAPDTALFLAQKLPIKLHITAAVAAFVIGLVILARPKGDRLHKMIGWGWVVAMLTTALSSLFITGINGDFYSFIHLISGWTLIALPTAIYLVRQGKVRQHAQTMVGLFVGGLLIAGGLTFLPGRLMFEMFFG